MTQQHIQVSHRDEELDAELRQSQADRFEKIERARNPQPDPPAKKAPAKEAAVKSATSKPFPPVVPKPAPTPAPTPPPAPPPSPPPQVSALPPGTRILTAEEMAAVDHLLQTHPETRQFFLRETR